MHDKERARKQELLDAHKDRLHQRQLQLAKYGLNADPSIITEIREIESAIVKLENELSKNPYHQKTPIQYTNNSAKEPKKQINTLYFALLFLLLGLVFFGIYLFFAFQPYAIGSTWKKSGYELTLTRVSPIGSRLQVEWLLTNNTGRTIELPATFYNNVSFKSNIGEALEIIGLVCPDGVAGINACDSRRYVIYDGDSINFSQYVQKPILIDRVTEITATFKGFDGWRTNWRMPFSYQ
jgi:hypothetical protein